jgi:hypothetical protein
MTDMNGIPQHPVDLDEAAEQVRREMQSLTAAREASVAVQESLPPSMKPFDQKAHDLLIKSIDQVATDWVAELEHVRDNSKKVEQLVIERAAKVKADITALYLLGSAALAEAKRGDDVNERLAGELDKLSEERAA